MPTAAKLAAAFLMALVAAATAEAFKAGMPAETVFGHFTAVCAAIGAFWGWRIAGARAGRGWQAALAYGLQTAVAVLFWALVLFSLREMMLRALERRYRGPVDAVLGMFELGAEYLVVFAQNVTAPAILAAGGVAVALIASAVARRWS
ncbi:tellurium resistance protein [Rhodobacteraceae bacterium WD3A24]|nr:tellurium resistance protein [Rhodobacteraceae bacterium WD3A24]